MTALKNMYVVKYIIDLQSYERSFLLISEVYCHVRLFWLRQPPQLLHMCTQHWLA